MEQPLQLVPDLELKGLDVIIRELRGYKEGDCLKISQGNRYVCVIYRPTLNHNSLSVKIGKKLMQQNMLKAGLCKVQKVRIEQTKKVNMKVSKLDWQLINSRSYKLQQQFINQVNLVWPNAKIPLYYTKFDHVVLKCQSNNVLFIHPQSQVEFDCENDPNQIDTIKQIQICSLTYSRIQQAQRQSKIDFGYENTIMISQQRFNQMKLDQKQLYNVQNTSPIPQQNLHTIHAFNRYLKQMQISFQPLKKRISRIIQMKVVGCYLLKDQQYTCSDRCKRLCGLQDKINLTNKKQSINTVGLQFFIKEDKTYLQAQIITDNQYHPEQVKKTLIKLIVKQIINNSQIDILHSHIMMFQKQLIIIKLSNKENNERFSNIRIINTHNLSHQQIRILEEQLQKKILIKQKGIQGYPSALIQILNFVKYTEIPRFLVSSFIGVYENQMKKIKFYLDNQKPKILVTSKSNNGKTLLKHVLNNIGYNCWYINLSHLNDQTLNIEQVGLYLQSYIQLCPYQFIYMDNLDNLCYKVDDGDVHRQQQRIISKILLRKILKLIKMHSKSAIFTATSVQNIDSDFNDYEHVILKNVDKQQRNIILQKAEIVRNKDIKMQQSISFGQLMKYVKTGTYRNPKQVKKILMDFSKLAGLKMAKQFLKKTIEKPLKYSSLYKKLPIKMPRGVLLYGATGTGKTALGHALKDELSANYFSIKGSDILSKYIGGSEAAVRQIFEKAISVSPSIIFFDQFQTMVPKRNAMSTGVNDRVVNQFLCYLDGVQSTEGVFIVAASSRPDLIDPALLRPGRLDIHLFLDYPTAEERIQLLELYSNSVKIEIQKEYFVKSTQDYNFSDLVGLFKELRIKKSSLLLKSQIDSPEEFKIISTQFYKQIISTFKISVQPQDQLRQRKIYEKFRLGQPPSIKQQKTMLM